MRIVPLALLAAALAGCGDPNEPTAAVRNGPAAIPSAIDGPVESPKAEVGPVIYKAVGNEPGWALTIRRDTMAYLGDYGSVRISAPTPADFRPAAGRYSSGRLVLTISPGPCSDGMSDLVYRQTVGLVAAGKAVSGCGGGTIAPGKLADTRWTVVAINGRTTPGGQNYFFNFTVDDLSAKFGCNSFGGPYKLNGDHLAASDLHVTEMACGEPERTLERLGGAILSSNMRIERLSGTRIRLVSEAGSIDLSRAI